MTERHPALNGSGEAPEHGSLTIRSATDADARDLSRLVERDATVIPPAPLLVAEVDGRLLAAISLADGIVVADPFLPSGGAAALLRLRFRQLQGASRPSGGLLALLRRTTRRRSRAALAGSPPGAGGRLLRL